VDGRAAACGLFFLGSASLVAYSFGGEINRPASAEGLEAAPDRWRTKMMALGLALSVALVAFAGLSLALNDPRDYDVPFVALMSLVPSLCTVPYLTLATRKPYAAVVFAVALVAALKLLGCVIVVLTHGWDASERGYTRMPWTDPNLLVWAFWGLTSVYSAALYALGVHKYQSRRDVRFSSPGQE
jgi:hypothetical protein